MAESDRRRRYAYNRVLIEAERILDPQFDDAVVFLSGAQLEMLRNVTQYLNRLGTYVMDYQPGYYLTPTPEDYDEILGIVADLEETLMGNPNTIFGLAEVLREVEYRGAADEAEEILWFDAVPEGEVWRLESVYTRNEDSGNALIFFRVSSDVGYLPIMEVVNAAAAELSVWDGMMTLKEGQTISVVFSGCTIGDTLHAGIKGYTMVVSP